MCFLGTQISPIETTVPAVEGTVAVQSNTDSVSFRVDPTLLDLLTGFIRSLGQVCIVTPLQTDRN